LDFCTSENAWLTHPTLIHNLMLDFASTFLSILTAFLVFDPDTMAAIINSRSGTNAFPTDNAKPGELKMVQFIQISF
jgi:hypothetical protein